MTPTNKTSRLTTDLVNAMDLDEFVAAFGNVFERSPWVAELAWQFRPFRNVEHLSAVMSDTVRTASQDKQFALLRAHPQLAYPEDHSVALSDESRHEQLSAGFDQCTLEQRGRLVDLNAAFREKFDFAFIIAVRGLSVDEILAAMLRRLDRDPDRERETAMYEIGRIARSRLMDFFD